MPKRRKRTPPIANPVAAYRREGETVLIEISLGQTAQLYNSFDPSPFHEKELDGEADRYIFDAVRDIGADKRTKLVIYLPAEAIASPAAKAIGPAIRSHYLYRLQIARRDIRHEWRRGRISLAIGLVFLAACMGLREFALDVLPQALERLFGEGLLIIGWVAMWGPLEVFLYGWWPLAGKRRILERLTDLEVELRPQRPRAEPGLGGAAAPG